MTETNGTPPDASGPTPGSAAPQGDPPASTAPHDPAPHSTAPHNPAPHYFRRGPVVMLVIAALIVAVDQIAKVLAVANLEDSRPIELIGDTVRLVLLRNPGAAFSMGTEFTVVLSIVATVVVAGLLWFSRRVHSRWWAWGLGLILGGAAGNLVDRYFRAPGILQGHVVDYMAVGWWPVFNVADASLVTGVIVVAVAVFRNVDFDGSRVSETLAGDKKAPAGSAAPADEKDPADG
ncbi:signal peptidase II [Dietzia sp. 111N12-1]|uniref:signal peptidase II n=1 Tax=Dietzia sp. 111N12-1 TaxID=1785156 RepID=UPI000805C890|nr:signal peptidase II [Dietzia sp. 111N12-1]OAV78790.1 lipoprotein signal peptidase [Dietzia sp. 111N12-1]